MKWLLFLVIPTVVYSDILSDIFNSYQEEEEIEATSDSCEPEHYSWDGIYLDEYPEGVEVIILGDEYFSR